ncbi:bifunctional DNA primase/polymerase [Mycolicibacterium sp. GESEQ-9]|uniref:bifunctional DNA primase/polymerase n=1 Tax=Mycolicibacterium sp. GESEQ-9 TaxID=2812656 RepID=UPI001B3361D9|nr:bifunctional DNA primase/polymerase [Mycolicibacterium sp. GESEQ-9]
MTDLDVMLGHGFSVGPLNGKAPRTRHGVQDFTRNPDVIAGWRRRWPGSNWGVTQPGVIALDVDPRNGGNLWDLNLRPEHKTLTVQTGSGGWHIYYRVSGPVRGKVQGVAGIDVKAGGSGYLVAPGSIHPVTGKPYRLHRDAPIADLPEHLLALVAAPTFSPPSWTSRRDLDLIGKRGDQAGDRWDGLIRAVQDAQPGNRNGTLFWAAARAAADGAPPGVYSDLAAAAHQIGLPTNEIQQTIRSAQRKGVA